MCAYMSARSGHFLGGQQEDLLARRRAITTFITLYGARVQKLRCSHFPPLDAMEFPKTPFSMVVGQFESFASIGS